MDKAVRAGQAVYSETVLSIYDWWVLGISNSYIWKCPTDLLEHEFRKHASANHLDIGVGTGHYLSECLPENCHRVGLIDLNQNSLNKAKNSIPQFPTETFLANVLAPFDFSCAPFESVSLNFLLHCLPGSIHQKAVVFDHIDPLLKSNAHVFGSTLLTQGVQRNTAAKSLMALYNRKGIFCNNNDSLDDLNQALQMRFKNIELYTVGAVAIFSANKK